jgi:hypothetical protein
VGACGSARGGVRFSSVEPERFDDVGFEILEVPDTARPRRPRPRPRFVAVGVLACSAASLVAAAALAVTPAQAPQASHHGGPGARSPIEFSSEHYPARGAGRHPCHRGMGVEPSTPAAPEL